MCVGAIAVQTAHARGIHVIGTARSGKEEALRKLGAGEVIVYDRGDVVDAVKAAHPDGITGVIDLVNDAAGVKRLAAIVRKGGRIVSPVRSIDDVAWFAERGITASNLAMGQTPQSSRASLEELVALIEAGTLVVDVQSAYPLEEAGTVLAALKSGKISGNIVLNIAPGE
jgi:NADPH:quinone reductase-like Zn-dependent oxidoreductase